MVGCAEAPYHLEFTTRHVGHAPPTPTAEDLLVLYMPDLGEWRRACESMVLAGFVEASPVNPYWAKQGKTFLDQDGYRVVLQNSSWSAAPSQSMNRPGF